MVRKDIWWKIFYFGVITIFGLQILYCLYQFLIVWNTGNFLLFQTATEIPFETMITRRLYAIELWISIIGLVIFIAIMYKKMQPAGKS
jgi:hypothetical protein